MREPPDPLRHSFDMNLDQTPEQEAELSRLTQNLKMVQREAFSAVGEEQIETATRRQNEAQEAIDNHWRKIAAEQVEGAADEFKLWLYWCEICGERSEVRVELSDDR